MLSVSTSAGSPGAASATGAGAGSRTVGSGATTSWEMRRTRGGSGVSVSSGKMSLRSEGRAGAAGSGSSADVASSSPPTITGPLAPASSSTIETASGSGSGSAGSITHVDGTIRVDGSGFELTPKGGGDPVTFTLGPEVQLGEVRAIEATGAPARVSYRPGSTVAAAGVPAPKISEELRRYVGEVTAVDARSITIDGDDGERTFDISGADDGGFDVQHLRDHQAERSPVAVYYDPEAPDVGVAYEDA